LTLLPASRLRCSAFQRPSTAEAERLGRPLKLDFSHVARQTALPGVMLAPTVALFAERADGLSIVSIAVNERVFRSSDGESARSSRSTTASRSPR
jgi:hypothetical protein